MLLREILVTKSRKNVVAKGNFSQISVNHCDIVRSNFYRDAYHGNQWTTNTVLDLMSRGEGGDP